MAHGDAREEKWRENWRMEWVVSKRHMTAEHRLARAVQTLQADVYSSPASSRGNWFPRRFKKTCPLRRKTKSGFCACAITFQTQSTSPVARTWTRWVQYLPVQMHIFSIYLYVWGTQWRSWLRHRATRRNVAVSMSDRAINYLILPAALWPWSRVSL
jgi:hypothetical protein